MISRVGSYLSQSVYSVATPFHPFGGAVDIIAVQQQDGSFRSTPWYVRFGKFQGVLKGSEKIVKIEVNGVLADFHMYLDNSGEAYFIKEATPETDIDIKDSDSLLESKESKKDDFTPEKDDSEKRIYEFQDEQISDFGSNRFDNIEADLESNNSEVVLFSIDGQILSAPITSMEENMENVQLSTPQFHLGPLEGPEFEADESIWLQYLSDLNMSKDKGNGSESVVNLERELSIRSVVEDEVKKEDVFKSCLALNDLGNQQNGGDRDVDVEELRENETEDVENGKSLKLEDLQVGNECEGIENGESLKIEVESESVEKVSDVEIVRDLDSEESEVVENVESLKLGVESESTDKVSDVEIVRDHDPEESEGVENVESLKLEVESESTDKVSDVEIVRDHDSEESKGVENVKSLKLEVESEITDKVSEVEIVRDHDQRENNPNGSETDDGCTTSVTEKTQPYSDDNEKSDRPRQTRIEISLCGNLFRPGMGLNTASETFNAHRIPEEEFRVSAPSIIKNDSLIVKIDDKYFTWEKSAHIVLGMAAYGLLMPVDPTDAIPVEWTNDTGLPATQPGSRWRLWPIPFRRTRILEHNTSNLSGEDVFLDSESVFDSPKSAETTPKSLLSPKKQFVRTQVPTTEQISSLNLKEGQNMVSFIFSTRVLGIQKVDAHIYLWKWNARIVISDVDGTITKSDVLGQFMPLVGKDWTQSGVARLFSAIKENGYQLLFLSARAIVQAYLTRNYLINLKQDGKALPNGPVVISPDGLFPSLFREVIRRAPHEFKIACLQDIKDLFPPDYNPFYAGFGNRDTDELTYRKMGIPKGKIFIINPKGEVAISHRVDTKGKSYTSLHTLVNDMFPPTSMVEQEDYNSWNYWRVPLPDPEL